MNDINLFKRTILAKNLESVQKGSTILAIYTILGNGGRPSYLNGVVIQKYTNENAGEGSFLLGTDVILQW